MRAAIHAFVFSLLMLIPATASADFELVGEVKGIEFFVARDAPGQGCISGGIKNNNTYNAKVTWTYVVYSKGGNVAKQAMDWTLSPGEGVRGWAAIMFCPFNVSIGGAETSEKVGRVSIRDIRVINLDEQDTGDTTGDGREPGDNSGSDDGQTPEPGDAGQPQDETPTQDQTGGSGDDGADRTAAGEPDSTPGSESPDQTDTSHYEEPESEPRSPEEVTAGFQETGEQLNAVAAQAASADIEDGKRIFEIEVGGSLGTYSLLEQSGLESSGLAYGLDLRLRWFKWLADETAFQLGGSWESMFASPTVIDSSLQMEETGLRASDFVASAQIWHDFYGGGLVGVVRSHTFDGADGELSVNQALFGFVASVGMFERKKSSLVASIRYTPLGDGGGNTITGSAYLSYNLAVVGVSLSGYSPDSGGFLESGETFLAYFGVRISMGGEDDGDDD